VKFSYDPRYNIAYLGFKERVEEVETIKVGESLFIDLAPDGTIYGIEFLNANEQILHLDRLLLVNEATGQSAELSLPS